MKRAPLSATALVTATAFLCAACSDLPPGQPGPFSNGAAAGGNLARAATVTSAGEFATGSSAGTVAAATVVILAKHQASLRQQQVAKANAKVAIAKLQKKAAARAATPPASTPTRKTGDRPKIAEQKKPRTQPRIPRYIAVETVKDERTAPQAAKAVVIFDTDTQEIVGNNVYDVKAAPSVGTTAKFETYTAEYVGSGS